MSDIRATFDRGALARVCTMRERNFGKAYGLDVYKTDHPGPENFYFFGDHGSSVLAVAHLDTVGAADQRGAHFIDTEAGEVVYSRALDDRLGAYTILEWLPALGIQYDILLTVGEESGNSTASAFDHPDGKQYDWIIEFDRGGTDVVMYQYDDAQTRDAVRMSGARPEDGIFSDISYLEHLKAKAFNWGVGYRDYHGPRAHAYLEDTYQMLGYFLKFHGQNYGTAMPHVESDEPDWWTYGSRSSRSMWDDDYGDPGDLKVEQDEDMWTAPDALDDDWIEYPTAEQMQAFERREAAFLSEYDR